MDFPFVDLTALVKQGSRPVINMLQSPWIPKVHFSELALLEVTPAKLAVTSSSVSYWYRCMLFDFSECRMLFGWLFDGRRWCRLICCFWQRLPAKRQRVARSVDVKPVVAVQPSSGGAVTAHAGSPSKSLSSAATASALSRQKRPPPLHISSSSQASAPVHIVLCAFWIGPFQHIRIWLAGNIRNNSSVALMGRYTIGPPSVLPPDELHWAIMECYRRRRQTSATITSLAPLHHV